MISIRKSRPDEWKSLQLLNEEVMINNPKYDSDLDNDWTMNEFGTRYFQQIANSETECCYVAEEDTRLVGYIAASHKDFEYRFGRYLEVENLGVKPEYHGKGIGTKLFEAVKKWAVDHGYTKIYVNSFSKNVGAIAFYKKTGFEDIDVSMEMKISD